MVCARELCRKRNGFLAPVFGAALSALLLSGCRFVPKSQLDAAETHYQALLEQKNALLAENENLKTHSRNLEELVKQAEEELAELEERAGTDDRRLSVDGAEGRASVAHKHRHQPIISDDDGADRPLTRRADSSESSETGPDTSLDGWTAPGTERR